MKKALIFLFLAQGSYLTPLLSQTIPEKPASDACPNWNKKQVASKADYFSYLSKRNKVADKSDFNTPKYQNFNAVKTSSPVSSGKQNENTFVSEKTNVEKSEEPIVVSDIKNASSRSVRDTLIHKADKPQPAEEKKAEPVSPPKPILEKGIAGSGEEKKVVKQNNKKTKHHKEHWFKKISFRRKTATTCPDF